MFVNGGAAFLKGGVGFGSMAISFQALDCKCWVDIGTSLVITKIIFQQPVVSSDFENLAEEILRLSDFLHKLRHPIEHHLFPVITKPLLGASNYIKPNNIEVRACTKVFSFCKSFKYKACIQLIFLIRKRHVVVTKHPKNLTNAPKLSPQNP